MAEKLSSEEIIHVADLCRLAYTGKPFLARRGQDELCVYKFDQGHLRRMEWNQESYYWSGLNAWVPRYILAVLQTYESEEVAWHKILSLNCK